MKITKKNLIRLIETFLFEKKSSKISDKDIKFLKPKTGIKHDTGYEYTVKDVDSENVRMYRYDEEGNEIYDTVSHEDLKNEYELV